MIQKNDILLLNQPKNVLNHTKNDYLFLFLFFFSTTVTLVGW